MLIYKSVNKLIHCLLKFGFHCADSRKTDTLVSEFALFIENQICRHTIGLVFCEY